jgi:hypothetical protein
MRNLAASSTRIGLLSGPASPRGVIRGVKGPRWAREGTRRRSMQLRGLGLAQPRAESRNIKVVGGPRGSTTTPSGGRRPRRPGPGQGSLTIWSTNHLI